MHGRGRLIEDAGIVYQGEFLLGERHGAGCWINASFESGGYEFYDGQWKHNKREGKGRLTCEDGSMHDGKFTEPDL